MDKKTLLCIKSKNSFHHFLKYTLIVFYISILSCVKLLENYMILSWHLDYRCEEWITCIFQNLFQCVCETFLKTLLGCPFGGTCLQPVESYYRRMNTKFGLKNFMIQQNNSRLQFCKAIKNKILDHFHGDNIFCKIVLLHKVSITE